MDNELITGNEKKIFFQYLIPSMLSMLAVSMYSFVDTFVVGQAMGAQAVAAMGLGTPAVSLLYALGFLCGSGGAISYAVAQGRGESKKATEIYSAALLTALILWLVIGLGGNATIRTVARFLGATEGNIDLTVEYLHWILSLSGFLILDLVLNNFMRNEGHPTVSMVATVTGTGLNIVLDFLFVMGFHWGMGGAASATCLASIISVAINFTYTFIGKTRLKPRLSLKNLRHVPQMFRVGLGACVLEGAVAVISVVFLNAAGKHYGDTGVSAFSVLITLNLVVYSLLNGVAQAVQPMVSANFAAGRQKRIRTFVRYGLTASLGLGTFFFAVAQIFTRSLVKLFVTDSAEVIAMANAGLHIYAFAFLFMSVSILLGITLQAETKAIRALLILLGRSAGLPVLILIVLSFLWPAECVWVSIPAGEGLAMVLAAALYLYDR